MLIISLIVFNLILPLAGITEFAYTSGISSIMLIGLATYAITRDELLDIRIIVQRGLVYAGLAALISGTYVLLGVIMHSLFAWPETIEGITSAALTTLLGVMFVRPLERSLHRMTQTIFFREHYEYTHALAALGKTFHSGSSEEQEVIARTEATLRAIFKTNEARILIDAERAHGTSMPRPGAPLLTYPMRFASTPLGVIMLGVVVFLTAFFLVFVVYVQASALFDSRRHAQELQLNRELADKAEASRFTELRNFLESELEKLAKRDAGAPASVDGTILARLDRLEQALLTALEHSENSVAAYVGELEDRIERGGALPRQ